MRKFFEDDEDDLCTDLTESEEKLLDYIEDCVVKEGMPPTALEIIAHCGWRSPAAATYHLKALEKKGRIQIIPKKARGIKLMVAP